MELRYLNYFLVLAQEMSFNRAARRLNLSQPPLSRRIRLIEKEFGVQLLERSGKRFKLTEAGLFLKEGAARLLESAAVLERQLFLVGSGAKASIRIGCIGSAMFTFFPELLAYVQKNSPELRFEILEMSTEEQTLDLASGTIDLGFLRSWGGTKDLRFEELGEEPLSAIYPSSMREGRPPFSGIVELRNEPYISGTAPGLAERILELCKAGGVSPRIAYECNQFASILRLVATGLGWSIVPTNALKNMSIQGMEQIYLSETIRFGLAYRAGALPQTVSSTIELARAFTATQ
jgi:DNA-binding transcriptional LysR family regulator